MLFIGRGTQNDHEEEREIVASALIGIMHFKQEASVTANLNIWISPLHPSSLLFMGQSPLFANKDKKQYLLLLEKAAIICYEWIQSETLCKSFIVQPRRELYEKGIFHSVTKEKRK